MPKRDLCVWCVQPKEVYITNGRNASLCQTCCDNLLPQIAGANRRQQLPHLYEGEERRIRPMPKPFLQSPKLDEFKHGGTTND